MPRIRKHPTFLSIVLYAVAGVAVGTAVWEATLSGEAFLYLAFAALCVPLGRSFVAWTSCSECHQLLGQNDTERCPSCRGFFHPIGHRERWEADARGRERPTSSSS